MRRAIIYTYDSAHADSGSLAAPTKAKAEAGAKREAKAGHSSAVYRLRAQGPDLRRLLCAVYNHEEFAENFEEIGRWVTLHRTDDTDDPYSMATYAVRWEPGDTVELSERDKYIVELHVVQRKTLIDIGAIVGVSGERARQVVRKAGVSPELTEEIRAENASAQVVCVCEYCEKEYPLARCRADDRRFCSQDCFHAHLREQLPDDKLLVILQDLAERLGRTPTNEDIQNHTSHSHTIFYDRFGSLRKAQRLAGLKPNKRGGNRQ